MMNAASTIVPPPSPVSHVRLTLVPPVRDTIRRPRPSPRTTSSRTTTSRKSGSRTLTPPPGLAVAASPDGHVAHHGAVRSNWPPDDEAANPAEQCALRTILAAQPGGRGPEKMTPRKAPWPAVSGIEYGEVRYELERHARGLAFVQQTRAVSLIDGREFVVADRVVTYVHFRSRGRPCQEAAGAKPARGSHRRRCLARCEVPPGVALV